MISLVGYTGFVGSNILESAGNEIDRRYNSKNIEEAFGTNPDLLIFSGLRAEKYLANNNPSKDMELIIEAEENIARIRPKKLVLISTIDVFKTPKGVDENSAISTDNLHPYGYNRFMLETWVRENYEDSLIIRLPGLFGNNIKKNFIYDYINVIPFMLKKDKLEELSIEDRELERFYVPSENGFFKVSVNDEEKKELRKRFRKLGFSALNFTDSRSRFQFYNLSNLWKDINIALEAGISLWHPATEPILASELFLYLSGERFENEIGGIPADYDYRSIHAETFGGADGYIESREKVMQEIREFVESQGEYR